MRIPISSLLLVCLLTGRLMAADAFDPAARAKIVAPFVDNETLFVLHADVSRLDVNRLVDYIVELIPDAKENEATTRAGMNAASAAFRTAGGKDLYVVVGLGDLHFQGPPTPSLIVPLSSGAEAAALKDLFAQTGSEVTERVGDVLFVGSRSARERLPQSPGARLAERTGALDATGNTAVQVLLLLSDDHRRVIHEMMPELPEEIGGGSSGIITSGLRWAAIGMEVTPEASLRIVVQSEDPPAARALHERWVEAYGLLGRQEGLRRRLPTFDEMAQRLTPRVDGNHLVLRVDQRNRGVATLISLVRLPIEDATESARRAAAMNHLKQFGLGMQNHVAYYKHLPAPASYDPSGKPLLSWRVFVLPFMEQKKLYDKFHLDEPWDSEHNRKLIDQMPAIFRSPASKLKEKGLTSYLVPVGPQTVFPGGKGLAWDSISDGTAWTIMVVEVDDDHAVIWTKPEDLPYDPDHPTKGLGGLFRGCFCTAFCDGSCHAISMAAPKETIRALFTRAGGEKIKPDEDFHPSWW